MQHLHLGHHHPVQPDCPDLSARRLCNARHAFWKPHSLQFSHTCDVYHLYYKVMLAMPFGNLIGARLFLHFGYYVTFAASGFFAFSGAVYVAIFLKETVVKGPKDEKEKQNICQVSQNQNKRVQNVAGSGGEEPSDNGEVPGEASEWLEEGTHSLQLLHACHPQSLLQGAFLFYHGT